MATTTPETSRSLLDKAPTPRGVVPQRLRPHQRVGAQVSRSRLLERIAATDRPIVVLRAGAGYGKSTVLSQLAADARQPVAWITLDASDADPMVLARNLVHSLALGGLDVAAVEASLRVAEPKLWASVIPAVASALDEIEVPFLLIVDDLHLASGESAAVIERLLDLLPIGSRAVLAGRGHGGLHLARRALTGPVLQIEGDELSFDDAEAREFVLAGAGPLPAPVVDELLKATESWPAGLHFAVLALRDRGEAPATISELLSSDQHAVEYLQQEALHQLEPGQRAFLVEISVLDHVRAPLCDAVTQRSDSAQILAELAGSGLLFLSPTVGAADAYGMHQLFTALLLAELRSDRPDSEGPLRRRAALWHDSHGEPDAAVRQAIAAQDLELAAQIVYRNHAEILVRGEVSSLQRWTASFPGDMAASNGLLALAAGWAALTDGDRNSLEHYVQIARAHSVDGALPDGSTSHALATAALEMVAGLDDVATTIERAQLLIDAGPRATPWWRLARLQIAVANLGVGVRDAVAMLARLELDTRGQASVHLVALSQLALTEFRLGDTEAAGAHIGAAVREAAESGLSSYPMVGMFHCVASLVAAADGDEHLSRAHAEGAGGLLRISRRVAPRAAIQARQTLAEAALLRGDVGSAAELLHGAAERLGSQPDVAAWHRVQQQLERRLSERTGQRSPDRLSDAELRVLRMLPSHRSLEAIGAELFISRNTVKSHTMAIYRKLGVSGRSAAVARATSLGLVEPG